jgi:hypothetical protein
MAYLHYVPGILTNKMLQSKEKEHKKGVRFWKT